MVSKMVTDRQKNANALAAALTKHAEGAHARFSDLVQPYLREDEQVPDLVLFQELLQRHLAAVRKNLVEVDDHHHWERRDDGELRAKRDQAVLDLSSLLIRLRFTVNGAYGANASGRLLAIEGRIPRDPVVLQRYAGRVLERLEAGSMQQQSSILEGVSIDAVPWVRLIEEPLGRLDRALVQLSKENRATIDSQVAKNARMADYDRAYRNSVKILESVFRFVGMDELAERVRPSPRRRSSPGDAQARGEGASQPPEPAVQPLRLVEPWPRRADSGAGPFT